MDKELLKQVLTRELERRLLRYVEFDPTSSRIQHISTPTETIIEGIAHALIEECEWAAKISAGFSPNRRCPVCNGPIEETRARTCLRCEMQKALTLLRLTLERVRDTIPRITTAIETFTPEQRRDLLHTSSSLLQDCDFALDRSRLHRGEAQTPRMIENFDALIRAFGTVNAAWSHFGESIRDMITRPTREGVQRVITNVLSRHRDRLNDADTRGEILRDLTAAVETVLPIGITSSIEFDDEDVYEPVVNFEESDTPGYVNIRIGNQQQSNREEEEATIDPQSERNFLPGRFEHGSIRFMPRQHMSAEDAARISAELWERGPQGSIPSERIGREPDENLLTPDSPDNLMADAFLVEGQSWDFIPNHFVWESGILEVRGIVECETPVQIYIRLQHEMVAMIPLVGEQTYLSVEVSDRANHTRTSFWIVGDFFLHPAITSSIMRKIKNCVESHVSSYILPTRQDEGRDREEEEEA